MHLLQFCEEAALKLRIELHPLELIPIILAVLTEYLTYADQLS